MAELKQYAEESGGRFLIFGSAAKDLVRPHSDLDVIIDFPMDQEAAAWERVEGACRAHRIPCDIHSVSRSSPAFIERMRKHAIMLA